MPVYILNDTIFRNVQVWQNYEYNRTVLFQKGGRGVAPENFWKYMHVQTFLTPLFGSLKLFDPPFWGVWNFFDPPFWNFKTFLTPLLIFQPPHQGIYERSLTWRKCIFAWLTKIATGSLIVTPVFFFFNFFLTGVSMPTRHLLSQLLSCGTSYLFQSTPPTLCLCSKKSWKPFCFLKFNAFSLLTCIYMFLLYILSCFERCDHLKWRYIKAYCMYVCMYVCTYVCTYVCMYMNF